MSKTKINKRKQKKTFKRRIIQKGGEDEICAICRETLKVPGEIYVHTCLNMFHSKCLKHWCSGKEECPCPMCRHPVNNLPYSYEEYNDLLDKGIDLVAEEKQKCHAEIIRIRNYDKEKVKELINGVIEKKNKKYYELVDRFNKLKDKYLNDRAVLESKIKAHDEGLNAYDELEDKFSKI